MTQPPSSSTSMQEESLPRVRFDRNELAGAFGDIGTDLPLIVGMILVSGIDSASVLIIYGLLQILTGVLYGMPMPVQPLKAVATLVIAQQLSGGIIYGAGFSIGIVMLILTATGAINLLARLIPKVAIRGIQFGLGLQLSILALTNYVQSEGIPGYVLAFIGFAVIIFAMGNRKYPPALFVIALGVAFALVFKIDVSVFGASFGLRMPEVHTPTWENIIGGFLLLALPQIPLSLGNSLLATHQIARDFFPEKKLSLKKIGYTYSLMNICAPLLSGIPVCHGSGGIAGHYTFGARTGGSVVIYGALFLTLGLFFSSGFSTVVAVFPLPILGIILLFEGIALMRLLKDTTGSTGSLTTAILVGLLCVGLPYGYLVGLVVGTVLARVLEHRQPTASNRGV